MKRNAQSNEEPTSCLTVMLAGFGLLAAIACACAVTFSVLGPIAVGIVLIPASIACFVLLHYLIWGWWAGKSIVEMETKETDLD